ncbi:MAG: DUF1778 domain-containing protein [Acidimicrobiia bacterium]|jgi:uncharacterized protein (DUF1778 family)|nr:DUF1778 domain-containing protein [Acidimicrobiia bacterium]
MADTLTGRLNFRLAPDQEDALRNAAAITGQSLSGFVLSSAIEHAHEVLRRANTLAISDQAFRSFVAALDEPTQDVPELVELLGRNSQIPGT